MPAELGVHLGDVLLKCAVYGLATPPGEPPLQMAQLSIVGSDAVLGIPVLQGNPGIPGPAATPFKWQFPSLSSTAELPDDLVDSSTDRGKAWVINDGAGTADIAYWTGVDFSYFMNAFGPGLPGPTPQVSATGEVVAEGDPFEVAISGSAENPNLHFKIPGTPGPPGDTGPWDLFDNEAARAAGDVPVWDAIAEEFVPGPPTGAGRVQRYTQPEGLFNAYSGSNASALITAMTLPTLPYANHIDIGGHVRVGQNSFSSARVALMARIGDPTSGQLIGRALGVTSGPLILGPHYSSQASGQTAVASSPTSMVGVLPANATGSAATIYVTAVRDQGSGGWFADAVDAQLDVTLIPVEE